MPFPNLSGGEFFPDLWNSCISPFFSRCPGFPRCLFFRILLDFSVYLGSPFGVEREGFAEVEDLFADFA